MPVPVVVAMPALRGRGMAPVEWIGVAIIQQAGGGRQALFVGVETTIAVCLTVSLAFDTEGPLTRLSRRI